MVTLRKQYRTLPLSGSEDPTISHLDNLSDKDIREKNIGDAQGTKEARNGNK